MILATSDLHGYSLDSFLKSLRTVGFGKSDTLYILGDVIDRNGDGGVAMLRWMMSQPNVEFILSLMHRIKSLLFSNLYGNILCSNHAEYASFVIVVSRRPHVLLQISSIFIFSSPLVRCNLSIFRVISSRATAEGRVSC